MLRRRRFWSAQGMVAVVAGAYWGLARLNPEATVLLLLLPVGLLWLPVIYTALAFGFAGALVTSLWGIISFTPAWLIFRNHDRPAELAILASLVAAALIIGHQADQKTAAEKKARDAAANTTKAQERERQRLGADLHDETIQQLVVVCQQFDRLRNFGEPLPAQTSKDLGTLRDDVKDIIAGIRNVIRGLRPPVIAGTGLVAAIRPMCEELKAQNIECRLEISGQERELTDDVAAALFRIVQEALRNIKRHARATGVSVNLQFAGDTLKMAVTDDGTGFDSLAEADAESRDGLAGIAARAEMIGGRLKIESHKNQGTSIAVTVPLKS